MTEQILALSKKMSEMQMTSSENVTNRSLALSSAPSFAESKDLKESEAEKRKVNKMSKNKSKEIRKKDYVISKTVVENMDTSDHSFKRIANTEDQVEDYTEQDAEESIWQEKRHAKKIKEITKHEKPQAQVSTKSPKTFSKERKGNSSKDKTGKNTENNSIAFDEKIGRNSKENKRGKESTFHHDDDDDDAETLILSKKEWDLFSLGRLMLPKDVVKLCIQSLKNQTGVSSKEIYKIIRNPYDAKLQYIRYALEKFLQKGLENNLMHEYAFRRYKI